MKEYAAGFDVGGTKCAVILGKYMGNRQGFTVEGKKKFATAEFPEPEKCLEKMCALLEELLQENHVQKDQVCGIGISCGGPLDSVRGIVQSPPNLPGWDEIPAVKIVSDRTGLPAKLENDANACALAEWKFGAGRGSSDMIFLTFGTGLGAGVIVNGKLCSGRNGMAGECGHIRIAPEGPVGYGKAGSFEGFCSGGGIAQLGKMQAEKALAEGRTLPWCRTADEFDQITAKTVGIAADQGDPDALEVYQESGRRLGYGLSILIDILNPEKIVIGSIFARSENLLRPEMERVIREEALPLSAEVCQIVPAELGEAIGDIASLSVAADAFLS